MENFNRDDTQRRTTRFGRQGGAGMRFAGGARQLPDLSDQTVPPVMTDGAYGGAVAPAPAAAPAEAVYDPELIEPPVKPGLLDRIAGDLRLRIAAIVLLVALALISAFPVRAYFTNPDTYQDIVATLDEKRANVMGLVGASTAASAGISLIPDDVGTPIAEKLMDLSGNLMIILAVISLEKYMLTVFGAATFMILVPAACAFAAIGLWSRGARGAGGAPLALAAKLVLLGAVLMLTVPVSVQITNMIDDTYTASITAQAEADAAEEAAAQEEEGPSNPLEFIQSLPGAIAESVTSVSDEALQNVNNLIEQAAVMIVTSCLVPLLVLAFFLWMAHMLLGVNIEAPKRMLKGRADRMRGWGSAARGTTQRYQGVRASKADK